jgi:uracil phosphoribosyltransferase
MLTNLEPKSKALQVLLTQSRRADLAPVQLSEVHRMLGRLLSYEYVEQLDLQEIEIHHVQGPKKGVSIGDHEFTLVLALMRSGLYVAEGFREILNDRARMEFISEGLCLSRLLSAYDLMKINVVLVDSVINTGSTVKRIIDQLPQCKRKTVVCQVMHKDVAESSMVLDPELHFIACRVSSNFYLGKGRMDTGNRLLGHVPCACCCDDVT